MTEREIEKKLVDGVRRIGGIAYKFISPGNAGVPDRLVILPGGAVWFVELKTDTGRLSAGQTAQISRIRGTGATVVVCRGEDEVAEFLRLAREAADAV